MSKRTNTKFTGFRSLLLKPRVLKLKPYGLGSPLYHLTFRLATLQKWNGGCCDPVNFVSYDGA